MTFVVTVGLLVLLAGAAALTQWIWRRRVERTRHKADYPLVDQYPPSQVSAMKEWPWG